MSLSYFFFFASYGVALPFLSPALLALGYTRAEVGLIVGCTYVFSVLVPVLGGRLTDRFLTPDRTIRIGSAAMACCAGLLMLIGDHKGPAVILLLVAFSAARSPMASLQDALAMQVAKDQPSVYARMRMVGSLGFVLGSAVFGYLVGLRGIDLFFTGMFVSCLAFAAQSLFLPKGASRDGAEPDVHFWRTLGRDWWLWLSAMVLHWIAFGPYHYGFTMLLQEQGVPDAWTGWYWSLGVAAEVGMFYSSGWFFARWRVRTLLGVALAANMLRWILVATVPTPTVLALTQLLHGLGFGLFYAAAMSAVAKFSGGTNRASYQGLFSSCVGGLGSVIGSIGAGALHNHMPMHVVMAWCIPVQMAALVLLLLNPLRRKTEGAL